MISRNYFFVEIKAINIDLILAVQTAQTAYYSVSIYTRGC